MYRKHSLLTLSLALTLVGLAQAQGDDTCATAQAISGTGLFAFDNTAATTDGIADVACGGNIENDVWFSWTAPTSGSFFVRTCGLANGLDTRLAVYDGACGGTNLACNDDSCGFESEIAFMATAGNVYILRVGSFSSGQFGSGMISLVEDAPQLNPANGNHYLGVEDPTQSIGWDAARAAAEATTFNGVQGHLATITDQAENDFIYQNLGGVQNYWVGGFQDLNDPSYSEPGGGWKWITGEPFVYTNWLMNEPNDMGAFPSEDFLELLDNASLGQTWNDAHPMEHPKGYVIEFPTGTGGQGFCHGDGGDQMGCTNCPCGNNQAPDSSGGCLNSSGNGGLMTASGTPSVSGDTLRIEMTGGVSQSFGVLTSGDAQAPANAVNPCFGLNSGLQSVNLDGLRCVVQNVQRHGSRPLDMNGDVGVTTNGWGPPNGPMGGLIANGGFGSGQTRYYQIIFREGPGLVCGTEQNTTQGVAVTFIP